MRSLTVFPKSQAARRERIVNVLLGGSVILLFLVAWELVFRLRIVNPLFVSAPSRVVLAGIGLVKDGTLFTHLATSGLEFSLGYGAAIAIGFPLGIMLGWFKLFNASFGPFVAAMQATPRVALMPLFIIWFGLGITSKIVARESRPMQPSRCKWSPAWIC